MSKVKQSMSAFYSKTIENIKTNYLFIAFIYIFGILTHGFCFFNKISYYDDINSIFQVGATWESGRWMLGILGAIMPKIAGFGNYSLPLGHGFLSLTLICISGLIIINTFRVEGISKKVAIAGVMVSIPSIACLFGYMFTAPYYLTGLLLSILGGILIFKTHDIRLIITGIILIACSTGVYQVYFSTACVIVVMYFIYNLFMSEESAKRYIIRFLKLIAYLALSLIFYFLFNKFFLYIKHTTLSGYIDLDSSISSSILIYLKRIPLSYLYFFVPNLNPSGNMFPQRILWLYWLILLISIFNYLYLLSKKTLRHKIQLIIPAALFPLAVNLIYVLSGEMYSLTAYNYVFVLVAVICLPVEWFKFASIKNINVVISLVITFLWIRFDNTCYLKAFFMQNEAISYFNVLIQRIQSAEGYKFDMPVTYINSDCKIYDDIYAHQKYEEITLSPYSQNTLINTLFWRSFMSNWCGFEPTEIDSSEFETLDEVKEMSCYPDEGSVKIINNTVVVKFYDDIR